MDQYTCCARIQLETQVAERVRERDEKDLAIIARLFLVIDQEGIFRAVNPAWTRMLGYSPAARLLEGPSYGACLGIRLATRDSFHRDTLSPKTISVYQYK
jgi:PAS domain-containing protein